MIINIYIDPRKTNTQTANQKKTHALFECLSLNNSFPHNL